MDLIIYHKSCPDGMCAAFVAKKRYPEAALLARDHGLEPPYEEVKGKDVLVVDFSWRTREQNIEMASCTRSFQILDHHKTAQATLEGLSFAIFDMDRSGAGLAWDFLLGEQKLDWNPKKPETQIILPRPWYVNYVEDRDLWRKQLPGTEEVNAYIMTLPYTLEGWQVLDTITPEQAFELGKGALAHVKHYVREALPHAQKGTLNKYPSLIINALYMNISEVAGELAKQCDGIGIGYFERGDGKMQFSLRSRNDVDVSAIAKEYGGGGHKNAAGFQLDLIDGRDFVDRVLNRPTERKRYLVATIPNLQQLETK